MLLQRKDKALLQGFSNIILTLSVCWDNKNKFRLDKNRLYSRKQKTGIIHVKILFMK